MRQNDMFINKGQQPHAKYGRDQCISCLRRLGFGLDKLALVFACHEGTIAKVIQARITEPRYTEFDSLWSKQRGQRNQKPRKIHDAGKIFEEYTLKELVQSNQYWKSFDSMYYRQYKDMLSKKRAWRKEFRQRRKLDADKYAAYIEKERVNSHLRKGKAPHEVPARGEWMLKMQEAKLTPQQQKEIKRIRRKRNHIRLLVRQVWRGQVTDVAALYRVGCTVREFQNWVELKMLPEWNALNYGKVWNFDHIQPCAAFDVFDPKQVKRVNHYTNIRPCCAMENSTKSDNLLD